MPRDQPLVQTLTTREPDVLELLSQRPTNKKIAENLFISIGTAKGQPRGIYQKHQAENRRDAVAKASALGILDRR